jgi:hypothetical protein
MPGINYSSQGHSNCRCKATCSTRGKRPIVLIEQKKALGIAVRNDRP